MSNAGDVEEDCTPQDQDETRWGAIDAVDGPMFLQQDGTKSTGEARAIDITLYSGAADGASPKTIQTLLLLGLAAVPRAAPPVVTSFRGIKDEGNDSPYRRRHEASGIGRGG